VKKMAKVILVVLSIILMSRAFSYQSASADFGDSNDTGANPKILVD